MPAFADIILLNGEDTPVSKTFSPVGRENGVASWAETSGGVALGFPTVTASSKRNAENIRVKTTVKIPVMETLGTADSGYTAPPSVAYTARHSSEFLLPLRSGTDVRKDILAFAINLTADAVIASLVEELESVHS